MEKISLTLENGMAFEARKTKNGIWFSFAVYYLNGVIVARVTAVGQTLIQFNLSLPQEQQHNG